jgi:peptide/nickel transport system substrate-binding protein
LADDKGSWKRFQRISFDSRAFSKRAKKAETRTARHAHKFVVSKLDSLRNAKQHVIIWLLIVGVLMGAVALQMVWFQKTYKTMAWKDGGTYAEGVIGPLNTLNPLYATSQPEISASKLIFSSLYTYDDRGGLSDDLATSLQTNRDGTEYIVTLRDDAAWNDGVNLTAEDVVFTVGLMKSPEARASMFTSWRDVDAEALDDKTVKFTLPASYASFPHALTFAVLPKHILEDIPAGSLRQNAFSVSPVGSGPFNVRLLQVSPDRKHKILNLSASDTYYKGSPRLSRFVLHGYASADEMYRALQIGEISGAANLGSAATRLPASFETQAVPVNSGVYALFNTQSSLLGNETLRKALQVGTDTTSIRQAVGYQVPALQLPFAPGQLSGDDVPKAPVYDPAAAAKLLDKAGWRFRSGETTRTNKKGETLTLRVVTIEDPAYENALEELAGQWRKLGIEIETQVQDPNNRNPAEDFVQATLQPRNFDVLLYELVIGADPDVYAYWHSSQATRLGYNFANYSDDISDDALSSARTNSDLALRNEKYKQFSRQWLKDAPAIGLYQSVLQYSYRNSVLPSLSENLPAETDRYSNILYWSAEQVPVYKTP